MSNKKRNTDGALVPGTLASATYPSPSAHFIDLLKKHQSTAVIHKFGQEVWSGYPVDEILVTGLSLVVKQVASKINQELETEADILNIIERIDRAFNAGLTLKYDSLNRAVQDFEQNVIGLAIRAVEFGYQPGMDVPIEHWQKLSAGKSEDFKKFCERTTRSLPADLINFYQKPAAIFFAGLLKTVRDYCETMSAKLDELEKLNRLGKYLCAIERQHLEIEREVLLYFDIWQKSLAQSRSTLSRQCQNLFRMKKNLEVHGAKIRICRQLPYKMNFNELTAMHYTVLGISLEFDWLNTQALLAAAEALTDREYLMDEREFKKAVRAIKKNTLSAAEELIKGRLIARGMSPEHCRETAELIKEVLWRVRCKRANWTLKDYANIIFRFDLG